MSKENIPKPKRQSTVAYIIVAWNNKDILDECIKSIYNQTGDLKKKTILIDNASSDDTVEYVTKNFPDIELLAESKNHGFARGNNIGIELALKDSSVEYVVLLNTDARLAPNWTNTLVKCAEQRPRAATLQSITLDYYDGGIIDSTHIYISRIGQGTQGSYREPLGYGYDVAPQKVFGCNAAAMMITRKFIDAQPFKKLFDETMFMYLEDVDLAARATIMGWDNYVAPGTRAHHMGSASSSKKDPSFALYMTFRNNTGLLIKNFPIGVLFMLFFRMPKADRASIKHLQRIGKGKAVPAVIKGRLISFLFIPVFVAKRYKLRPLRSVDKNYLWHLMRRGF